MNKILKTIAIGIFLAISLQSSFAQNRVDNVRTNTGSLLSNKNNSLTEQSVQRNTTGSCDSTCDAMSGAGPVSNKASAFYTQVVACGAGYTGSKAQTRSQNIDGSYTPWVDSDASQCICSPTYKDELMTCPSPQAGNYTQRTDWVCNNNVGSLAAAIVTSNSCYTPCVSEGSQTRQSFYQEPDGYQAGACYYTNGVHAKREKRDSICSSASATPQWGAWYTLFDECYDICYASQANNYQAGNCF